MARYRVRQSKPLAVVGAVFGVAVLVAGAVSVGFQTWFMWFWLALGAGIIAVNLWSAFGRNGHDQVVESDPGGPSGARSTDGDTPSVVSYRVRPGKGQALLVAAGGSVILLVGGVSMLRGGGPPVWFAVLFLAAGVFVVGATLWSAFAPNGRLRTIEASSDVPPVVGRGQIATRE